MNKGVLILIGVVVIFIGTLVYLVRDATSTLDSANTNLTNLEPPPTPAPTEPAKPVALPVVEQDLGLCEIDSDCLIVPYKHCCGTTKRAINQKWSDIYYGHPEWQKFSNPTICAVIGRCQDDSAVTKATCEPDGPVRRCRLKF